MAAATPFSKSRKRLVPTGFAAGLGVTLLLPACKCLVMPGSHNPGTASGPITSGATFKIIQKK